jgi:hypothetical protein
VYTSSKDSEGQPLPNDELPELGPHGHGHAQAETGASTRAAHAAVAMARDVSHEPRPAPPPTGQTAPIPPQIPTAGEASGKS